MTNQVDMCCKHVFDSEWKFSVATSESVQAASLQSSVAECESLFMKSGTRSFYSGAIFYGRHFNLTINFLNKWPNPAIDK